MYDFSGQLDKGESGEKALDNYYSQWYTITAVNMSGQKSGTDRLLTDKTTGMRTSVEYKTDDWTPRSGNVFIETVSVDTQNKPGWAYTSCAQWLIYYVPGFKKAYWITMLNVKHYLPYWIANVDKIKGYKKKRVPNNGYFTEGITVPLTDFVKCCGKVDDLP